MGLYRHRLQKDNNWCLCVLDNKQNMVREMQNPDDAKLVLYAHLSKCLADVTEKVETLL